MDSLPQLVDHAAEREPDRDAFLCEKQSISYADLAIQTNQLANTLLASGVQSGDRVGILMPRCIESAIAVHGIMKSGAAFVPLDPHSPLDALAKLISFCEIKVVVTLGAPQTLGLKSAQLEQLSERCESLTWLIGADRLDARLESLSWEEVRANSSKHPDVSLRHEDLAYIMFTSGSTGTPKGIMHTHSSGLSYARLSVSTYSVQPEDVIGGHSPLHFDMSTFGYFCGPLAGATTSLIPEAYTRLPASLSQLMEQHRISIWYSVPFALVQLHLYGVLEKRDLSNLRWIKYGGEPFSPDVLNELMQRLPQARFSNVYGPAEVNQCTFYHLPKNQPLSTDTPVPIGRVWDETDGIVVDEDDEVVPMGQEGELLISSPTRMQGYWARPELNDRAFFRQPSDSGEAKVFYRTGDLVRVDGQGEFVFLGRKDRQIKVRGYRVELEAIEQALVSYPSIEDVGVFAIADASNVKHIYAAVSCHTAVDLNETDVKKHIAKQLPWYAIPQKIMVHATLPRTPTGKVDRNQLMVNFRDASSLA